MFIFKYLRYYITTITLLISLFVCSLGATWPTIFLIGFSLFIIIGDYLIKNDTKTFNYQFKILLDLPSYINLPILLYFIIFSVICISNHGSEIVVGFFQKFFFLDIVSIKNSILFIDKISLIILSSLFIGIMGTVPAHELTHRKNNFFDMMIGNWLLAFSWDCAFAIEHVYGHHKNVGLPSDPATAKRNEGLYGFIIRAIVKEQKDAWSLEVARLKRRRHNFFSTKNRMLLGYFKSIVISSIMFFASGWIGLVIFLFISLISKFLLETINYIEHYGLIRAPGNPVRPAHSWNSNHYISSIYLCNVTRHSAHHEKSNLKFWELESYKDAPKTPFGYLSVLYLTIFFPRIYRLIMKKKLKDWDLTFATKDELKIIKELY